MTLSPNDPAIRMGYALLTADTPAAQVQAILALVGTGPLHAWLEDPLQPDGMRLRDTISPTQVQIQHTGVLIVKRDTADAPIAWQRWPQGHLFSPQADLRWEQIDSHALYVVVITACPLDAPFDTNDMLTLEPLSPHDERILLWGQYDNDNNEWQEGRIPSLRGIYPSHWNGPYAAIVTRTYEADWPEVRSVRTVTRYIRYDGNYEPKVDPRFT